jgi:hypothetical protein
MIDALRALMPYPVVPVPQGAGVLEWQRQSDQADRGGAIKATTAPERVTGDSSALPP